MKTLHCLAPLTFLLTQTCIGRVEYYYGSSESTFRHYHDSLGSLGWPSHLAQLMETSAVRLLRPPESVFLATEKNQNSAKFSTWLTTMHTHGKFEDFLHIPLAGHLSGALSKNLHFVYMEKIIFG